MMKGFFALFTSSFDELKKVRTITTTGMLMAIAIVLRSAAIEITPDIRISFAFIAIMAIAVLYGPVAAGMANISQDFLGYIIANHTAREYSVPLALVNLLAGVIYGIICYRAVNADEKESCMLDGKRIVRICFSRAAVVLICNICLNSAIVYTSYVNKDFSFFNAEGYDAFGIWLLPRVIKNLTQLIADIPLIAALMPVIIKAYEQVSSSYAVRRKKKILSDK